MLSGSTVSTYRDYFCTDAYRYASVVGPSAHGKVPFSTDLCICLSTCPASLLLEKLLNSKPLTLNRTSSVPARCEYASHNSKRQRVQKYCAKVDAKPQATNPTLDPW